MGSSLAPLLDVQQSDGGWAYSTNSSWTEPTCYAMLAMRSCKGLRCGESPPAAIGRAGEWLARRQRRDGGWPPGPAVDQSTHVTSLAILALTGIAGYEELVDRGVEWLLGQSGAETSLLSRIARTVMGTRSSQTEHVGWPWTPGAAAWVIPTSLAICALSKHRTGRHAAAIDTRLKEARCFLLDRRCPDQGWNHGGQFRPGEVPVSYPETTGIALMALGGCKDLGPSILRGERHYRDPRSSEGSNWLRLGLAVHGRVPAAASAQFRDWTVNQTALEIIAESGRNPFVESV